jgi:hypothetical protein
MNVSNQVVTIGNYSSVTVYGNGDTILGGTNDGGVLVVGNDNTLTLGIGGSISIIGLNDTVNETYSDIFIGGSTSITVNGAEDNIVGAFGDTVTVNGYDDQISLDLYGTATLNGQADSLLASSNLVYLSANTATIDGNNNFIIGTNNSIAYINGSGNTVNAPNNTTAYITGSGNTANMFNSRLFLYGVSENAPASANTTTITGTNNTIWGEATYGNTFNFIANFGVEVIQNFNFADVINIHGNSVLDNRNDTLAHTTQNGTTLRISDGSNTLMLDTTLKSNIDLTNLKLTFT